MFLEENKMKGSPFYYIIMGRGIDADTAFQIAKLREEAFYSSHAIRKKKSFEVVEGEKDKNPERLAEIWVEEDKDSPFYKKDSPAGCIELKGYYLTAARRKRPDLRGQKGIKAFLFFGKV